MRHFFENYLMIGAQILIFKILKRQKKENGNLTEFFQCSKKNILRSQRTQSTAKEYNFF